MKTSRGSGLALITVLTTLILCARFASAAVTNLSKLADNQDESFIVVNPTNPQNIVAFANEDVPFNTFRAYTFDGGATWTGADIIIGGACCDAQAVTFDQFGNLFVVYIDNTGNLINVINSTDGGVTFGAPVTVANVVTGVDQPSIAAGTGSLWVDWNQGSMRVRGAPVTGLGVFGPFNAVQTPPSATGNFGGIAVGPGAGGTGKVMITYMNPTGGQGPATIFVNVDPDGLGASNFGSQITVTATNVGGFDFIPAQSGRSIDAEPGLAWDATGGPFNNTVYLVYVEEAVAENNDTNIMVRISINDGTTWSAAVKVNDDATTRSQFNPYISMDERTGAVGVTFHDSRNDTGVAGAGGTNAIANDDAQYFATYSTDGGATWAANVILSASGAGSFSNDDAAANGVDYGDYVGTDTYCGVIWGAWGDNSNSTGDNPAGTLSTFDLYANSLTYQVVSGGCFPPPVGDGNPSKAAGTAAKFDKAGADITATWDKTTCDANNAVIEYGFIGTYIAYAGSADCAAGNSGSKTFTPPAGNVWFNIVWENGITAGHPGFATSGARTWAALGTCGITTDNSTDNLCN